MSAAIRHPRGKESFSGSRVPEQRDKKDMERIV